MEVTIMSEQSEKLVKIILPDLLNYLEMVESGEIIEQRIKKNIFSYKESHIINLQLIKQEKMNAKNKFCIFVKK